MMKEFDITGVFHVIRRDDGKVVIYLYSHESIPKPDWETIRNKGELDALLVVDETEMARSYQERCKIADEE